MTGFAALPFDPEATDSGDTARWAGFSKIYGPSWTHLPALTIGLLGVQIFWSVEMSYASPYLIQLGLTKSLMALVFLAGPLSGLIMQPLIGVLADNSKSRFGRRRPYMIGGVVVCIFAMLLLGYTRPFASIFLSSGTARDLLTIWLAVVALYCIDFSINAVQAVDRALLVDTLPPAQQASGNAWAARMLGIGSVVGFFVGTVNLQSAFAWLGSTQLEVLAVISSFLLIFLHGITAFLVKEKVLISSNIPSKTFVQELRGIIINMRTLPRVIRQICIIQFFAWIGWFPVIFYTTMYIGDIHKRASPQPVDAAAASALDAEGTRLGARALLYSSLVSLATNIFLPFFVAEARGTKGGPGLGSEGGWRAYAQVHLASIWASSHLVFAGCMAGTLITSSVFGSTVLITVTGFAWAITQWAPFSLLAEAILTERVGAAGEDAGAIRLADARARAPEEQRFLAEGDEDEDERQEGSVFSLSDDDEEREEVRSAAAVMGNARAQRSRVGIDDDDDRDGVGRGGGGGLSAKAGIILGIHNVFVVVPQFLVTGLSSVIFALVDPDKSVLHGSHPGNTRPPGGANGTVVAVAVEEETAAPAAGPNSVGIIFRVGGISAAIAFVLCWRLAREIRHR